LGLAGPGVEALDRAAIVASVRALTHRGALDIAGAAVVAEIERTVGSDRKPVRAAAAFREHGALAVGRHALATAVADLRQDHRSIRHYHRALGEAEAARQDLHVAHVTPPTKYLTLRRREAPSRRLGNTKTAATLRDGPTGLLRVRSSSKAHAAAFSAFADFQD